jgi:hypothetical protein
MCVRAVYITCISGVPKNDTLLKMVKTNGSKNVIKTLYGTYLNMYTERFIQSG